MIKKDIHSPIQFAKGVGPKRVKQFEKLGIKTIYDACLAIPRRYEDRSRITPIMQAMVGTTVTIEGEIIAADVIRTPRKRMKIFEITVADSSGIITGRWFHFNETYFQRLFRPRKRIILSGSAEINQYKGSGKAINHPDYEILSGGEDDRIHTGRIVPIYPSTEGLNQKTLRTIMKHIIDGYYREIADPLPETLRKKLRLLNFSQALMQVHFPENDTDLSCLNDFQSAGHRRLIFEEFFFLQLGLALRRKNVSGQPTGISFRRSTELVPRFIKSLPFSLTPDQKKVFAEIERNLIQPLCMNRLLQGDVGSGKTVVAVLSILTAIENGYQAVIMVPTEILAQQHYQTFRKWLEPLDIQTALLVRGQAKKDLLKQIGSGEIPVIVGTHALIQEKVGFKNLGLAIIDEQHRFGVIQRGILTQKASHRLDILVMTATPIPRSLALTVFGDLAVSTIRHLPPGRTKIITRVVFEHHREKLYDFLKEEIRKGGQVFIVYPLVEESEKLDLKDATQMAEHLKAAVFPEQKIALMHGRMKKEEKEQIMTDFHARRYSILVATTVIEVGLDVPNASVMVVEHADRFGLSQLHQLRGRVGRGRKQSYCFLISQDKPGEDAKKRLKVMVQSTDGFKIAEKDLEIRGPGDFIGTRQSGLPDLRIANIVRDQELLQTARDEAFLLIKNDPELKSSENKNLKKALESKWEGKLDLFLTG
jgi:ATP-dependent DNA helicase RecG